ARAHRHHARDVSVMVGAEHNDQPIEPALPLVQVVRQVSADVRGYSVALDDNTVLVIAEVSRSKPNRTVVLVDVSHLAKSSHSALHGPAFVQVVFMEVDVEVDTEVVQTLLDLIEHEIDAPASEDLLGLVTRSIENVRNGRHDLCCDFVDVLTGVAVVGDLL